MTTMLTKDTNDIPILIELKLGANAATGLDEGDLVSMTFFDARGQVQVMDLSGVDLHEIDEIEFPGLYVLTQYPALGDVSDPDTYLTKHAGAVRLKWAENSGKFDAGYVDLEVSSVQGMVNDLHLISYGKVEWNEAESSLDVYRDNGTPGGVLYKRIPVFDKDGGLVVIEGTGPVAHGKAVDPE